VAFACHPCSSRLLTCAGRGTCTGTLWRCPAPMHHRSASSAPGTAPAFGTLLGSSPWKTGTACACRPCCSRCCWSALGAGTRACTLSSANASSQYHLNTWCRTCMCDTAATAAEACCRRCLTQLQLHCRSACGTAVTKSRSKSCSGVASAHTAGPFLLHIPKLHLGRFYYKSLPQLCCSGLR
jgi:hypothetical protein